MQMPGVHGLYAQFLVVVVELGKLVVLWRFGVGGSGVIRGWWVVGGCGG